MIESLPEAYTLVGTVGWLSFRFAARWLRFWHTHHSTDQEHQMSKRARKRRAGKKKSANHGNKPNS